MQLLLIIILVVVVNNTTADETACSEQNYQTQYNGYDPNGDYYFSCYIQTAVCKNVILSTSLIEGRRSCHEGNYCDELIISNSLLTKIDDKVIDSTIFCKLIKLTINASRITSISEDAFYSLSHLRSLNLDNNAIKDLTFLSDLINLNSLSLEMNNLYEINAKYFKPLRKLQKLNLGHNNIKALGNSSYTLGNLQELYLNHNNISIIESNVLSKLTRLEILDLANNEFTFIDENLLEPLTLLRYVNFENNKIHAINDWVFSKSIRELNLRNNLLRFSNKEIISIKNHMLDVIDISGCSMKTLNNIFTSIPSITILIISNCSINEITPFAFNSLNKLTSLDLSKNNLNSLRLDYFAGLENLQKFSLEQNPIKLISYGSFLPLSKVVTLNITVDDFIFTNYTFKSLISLETLNFVDSNILKITTGSFSSYKHLISVELINTTLQYIEEDGFANTQSLRCINSIYYAKLGSNGFNLSRLSLQTIENNGFQSVSGLTSFYFDYNNISIISKNLFSNSLANVISFNHSGIRNIEPNAIQNIYFRCGSSYYGNSYCGEFEQSIFINNNNISVIQHHSFRNITNLHKLMMRNNSIKMIEKYAFDKLLFSSDRYTTIIDFSYNLLSIIQINTFVGIKNVDHVILDNNRIHKIIPGAFNTLNKTKILKLSYNDLKVIEENVFLGLNNLEKLYLDNNKLIQIDEGAFNSLKNIEKLNLSYNEFKVIEENIFVGLDNLNELYLDNNKLQTLMFNSFNGLERLRKLTLDNNQFKNIPLGTFRNVYSLNMLNLNGNELAKLMTGVFTNLANLKVLNLGNNNFSILNTNVFYPLDRLEDLYINNNSIFDVDYVSLKSHCSSLQRISLNFNYFNCTFLRKMLQYFRDKNINYADLIQDKIYHDESIDGILCSESISLIESKKSLKNKSENLQHNIFSLLNINPNAKDNANEIKLGNILKNMTDLLNSSISIINFKNAENKLITEKESKNNGDSGLLVFISMTSFAILLLLSIKTFNKTYFYKIKSAICRKRKPEIELIDTSEI